MLFTRKNANTAAVVLLTIIFMLVAGTVLASSDGGTTQHWQMTDWARVLNFVVLVSVLVYLLKKPVAEALGARIENIKEQLATLETQKADAEKRLADYGDQLSKLDAEAGTIIEEYIRQGNEARERILAEAEKAADKLQEQAGRNIENEFKRVKAALQEEILEKSLTKAEELIKDKITNDDQEKLVDEYLTKVVG